MPSVAGKEECPEVSLEIIRDTGHLTGLRSEWDDLLAESASNCVFLTWEWLSTWWRFLSGDRKLLIPAVRSRGRLVAIAPLVVRPPGISRILPFPALEFMGTGSVGSDYLDVIVRRGEETCAQNALAGWLAGTNRAVELEQVKIHGCCAAELGRLLGERGWSVHGEETNVSRHIDLAGQSWAAYLGRLGRTHRTNFNRRLRQIGRQFTIRFEKVSTGDRLRPALSRLIALHKARWGAYSRAFHTPNHVRFHEEMSQLACDRGWLRIFTLWLDDEPVAALYGFRYGGVFYFYQSGFDPNYAKYSVGLVTMGLSIKDILEEGVREYDMLQGVEAYKERWAAGTRSLGRLEFYPPQLRGLVYRGTMGLSRAARRAARRMLPRMIADRIATRREIPRET